MKRSFKLNELKKNGYVRYPRLFIHMLIRDFHTRYKEHINIGVLMYIFSRVAYKPYQYQCNGEQHTLHEGECVIQISKMRQILGCSTYAARKALEELDKEGIIKKVRLPYGVAVQVIGFKSLFMKDNTQRENE